MQAGSGWRPEAGNPPECALCAAAAAPCGRRLAFDLRAVLGEDKLLYTGQNYISLQDVLSAIPCEKGVS